MVTKFFGEFIILRYGNSFPNVTILNNNSIILHVTILKYIGMLFELLPYIEIWYYVDNLLP